MPTWKLLFLSKLGNGGRNIDVHTAEMIILLKSTINEDIWWPIEARDKLRKSGSESCQVYSAALILFIKHFTTHLCRAANIVLLTWHTNKWASSSIRCPFANVINLAKSEFCFSGIVDYVGTCTCMWVHVVFCREPQNQVLCRAVSKFS